MAAYFRHLCGTCQEQIVNSDAKKGYIHASGRSDHPVFQVKAVQLVPAKEGGRTAR